MAACALWAAACSGPQSSLDPAGPAAGTIATGWWWMAAVAVGAWSLVLVLLGLAMRRGRGLHPAQGRWLIVLGGVALPTVSLGALLVWGTLASDRITGSGTDVTRVVQVTARQWQWDFEYLDRDGRVLAASTDELALPLGEMVEFRVDSVDVIHSFWIPRLGGKVDAIPGRRNTLRLQADWAGAIRGQCAEFCGLDHALMAFDVVVLEAGDYEAWLSARALAATGEGGR